MELRSEHPEADVDGISRRHRRPRVITGFTVSRLPRGLWGKGGKSSLSLMLPHCKVSSWSCLVAFPRTVETSQDPDECWVMKPAWDCMRDRGWCFGGKGLAEEKCVPHVPISFKHLWFLLN